MFSYLQGIRIRQLVNVALLLCMSLFVAIGVLGLLATLSANRQLELLDRVAIDQSDYAQAGNRHLLNAMLAGVDYQNRLEEGRAAAAQLAVMDEHLAEAADYLARFRAMPVLESAEGRQLAEQFVSRFTPLLEGIGQLRDALQRGDQDSVERLERRLLREQQPALGAAMNAFFTHVTALADREVLAHRDNLTRYALLGALVGLFSVLLLAGLRLSLVRLVVEPVAAVVEHLQRLACADLSQRVQITLRNEIGQLQEAMQRMQDSLGGIVGSVRQGSAAILGGTRQIAAGNVDLSARTEQQAASLEETAASIEELTATVRQTADNARQASSLAGDASDTAEQGRVVVGQVVSTMQEIAGSSQRITRIIEVIDSIAFQTNILALNASVEAARAGEQGRGFAVVASEVRTLASRSAAAAGEIKTLIEESASHVQGGSQCAEQAGRIMVEVVAAVRRVGDIIDEISAAAQEQSQGIGQVNAAVGQLDQVTQQNATLVQQAASASAALAGQAQRLEQAVAVFRLHPADELALPREPAAAKNAVVPVPVAPVAAPRRESQPLGEPEWAAF